MDRGWQSSDSGGKEKYHLTKKNSGGKVREAATAYLPLKASTMTKITTISSKLQITLPVALVRELGLQPGDKLAVELKDGRLTLHPRPKDWVSYTAGTMPGLYGETKEEIDAYLRDVRGEWGAYPDDEDETSET